MGLKFRLPPRKKVKAWKAIHQELIEQGKESKEDGKKASVQMRHQVERNLKKIEEREENEGRKSLVKKLKRELDKS